MFKADKNYSNLLIILEKKINLKIDVALNGALVRRIGNRFSSTCFCSSWIALNSSSALSGDLNSLDVQEESPASKRHLEIWRNNQGPKPFDITFNCVKSSCNWFLEFTENERFCFCINPFSQKKSLPQGLERELPSAT